MSAMMEPNPDDFDRIVSPEMETGDAPDEFSLRPNTFGECIGQAKVKENLQIAVAAAKMRKGRAQSTPVRLRVKGAG